VACHSKCIEESIALLKSNLLHLIDNPQEMNDKDIVIIAGPLLAIIILMVVITSKTLDKQAKILFTIVANIVFVVSVLYHGFVGSDMVMFLLTLGLLDFCVIKRIRMGNDIDEKLYHLWHEDTKNWKLGIFYYNPRDKRVFPPKRFFPGMGWTVNFANADSVLVMMVMIVLIVLIMNALPFFAPVVSR
jgi:uncharacterized membrane protein